MPVGAKGYVSVTLLAAGLVDALRIIAQGSVMVSGKMAGHLSHGVNLERQGSPGIDTLSERQREVLAMVARGATNREIADTLLIAEATVKFHLRTVLRKLNLRHRRQAAIYAIREGLFRTTGRGTSPELAIPSTLSRHLPQGEGKQKASP